MAMVPETAYNVLGVPPGATIEEIRAAYRRLSKMHHPDSGGTPAFFRQVQDAYAVISDPERRTEYDAALRRASVPHTVVEVGTRQRSAPATAHSFPVRWFLQDLRRAINRLGGRTQGDRNSYLLAAIWITTIILGLALLVVLVIDTEGLIILFLVVVGVVLWLQARFRGG